MERSNDKAPNTSSLSNAKDTLATLLVDLISRGGSPLDFVPESAKRDCAALMPAGGFRPASAELTSGQIFTDDVAARFRSGLYRVCDVAELNDCIERLRDKLYGENSQELPEDVAARFHSGEYDASDINELATYIRRLRTKFDGINHQKLPAMLSPVDFFSGLAAFILPEKMHKIISNARTEAQQAFTVTNFTPHMSKLRKTAKAVGRQRRNHAHDGYKDHSSRRIHQLIKRRH